MKECFVVLGNQLFDKKYLTEFKNSCDFFIQEDMGLCSYFKHHKQKIYYFLASMREYRDYLKKNNFKVEECSAGMPTAFCAEWENGSGPTLATYAEYLSLIHI